MKIQVPFEYFLFERFYLNYGAPSKAISVPNSGWKVNPCFFKPSIPYSSYTNFANGDLTTITPSKSSPTKYSASACGTPTLIHENSSTCLSTVSKARFRSHNDMKISADRSFAVSPLPPRQCHLPCRWIALCVALSVLARRWLFFGQIFATIASSDTPINKSHWKIF